jgi:hypothetical protein
MAANHQPLFLHEEIMLLALRDETGVMESGAWYSFAMGGAILSELLLAGRVEIDGGKKPVRRTLRTGQEADAPLVANQTLPVPTWF